MFCPFSIIGSAFQAIEKKNIVGDGGRIRRMGEVQVIAEIFWSCLQDLDVWIP